MIDKCFGNLLWYQLYGNYSVGVLNPGSSDHSPLVLQGGRASKGGKKQFKFLNCLTEHPDFLAKVRQGWETDTTGVKCIDFA